MVKEKYLPRGSIIGESYEIVDILGEDDFEILYLVKDINRTGSFFVLKELFLETFSSREKYDVSTIPEAQGVFEKRKQQIISEVKEAKRKNKTAEIKIYGYIEQNNTIYTIMEFSNNADLVYYLQYHPKDKKSLPQLEELINLQSKKKSPLSLLKITTLLILLAALMLIAFKLFQEYQMQNKTTKPSLPADIKEKHPPLIEHIKERNKTTIVVPKNRPTLEALNQTTPQTKEEENLSLLPLPSIIKEATELNLTTKKHQEKNISSSITVATLSENNSTKKSREEEKPFSREKVQRFLNHFIEQEAKASVDTLLNNYDTNVKRYFKLRDVGHKIIKEKKEQYNKKWQHREFSITNFKILKTYSREGIQYCDVQTTTKWKVSNQHGKKASGKSRGFMTLKKVNDGYKVTSIYQIR